VAIAPNVPGFLGQINVLSVAPFWSQLYNYAWFIGFFVAFAAYGLMALLTPSATPGIRNAD